MQVIEPTGLPKVRALAAYLKSEPLIAEVLLLEGVVAEDMLCVVLLDDVLDDGAGFPERDSGIGILDGWSCGIRGSKEYSEHIKDIPGARPLGLMSMKGFCLTTAKLKELSSYGISSSSRTRTGFHGFGGAAGSLSV